MSKVLVITEDSMVPVGSISYMDMVNMMCAAITESTKGMTAAMEKEDVEAAFNDLNYAFSKCLENSFPDLELRGDISEEAIIELENQKLKEASKDLEPVDVQKMKENRMRTKLAATTEDHKGHGKK